MKSETCIGIIGAGPAGLTLGLLLHQAGIECVILEHRSREYIEQFSGGRSSRRTRGGSKWHAYSHWEPHDIQPGLSARARRAIQYRLHPGKASNRDKVHFQPGKVHLSSELNAGRFQPRSAGPQPQNCTNRRLVAQQSCGQRLAPAVFLFR